MRALLLIAGGLALAACAPDAEKPAVEPDVALDEPMEVTAPAAPENRLGLPRFSASTLTLANIPEPTGPALSLFNGEDLDAWESWLGYDDPGTTYEFHTDQPIGPGGKGTTGACAGVMPNTMPRKSLAESGALLQAFLQSSSAVQAE